MSLLSGKKTYFIALLGIIYAVSAYLTGNIGFENAIQLILVALGASALRNAIK